MPPKAMYKPKRKRKPHNATGTYQDPIVVRDSPGSTKARDLKGYPGSSDKRPLAADAATRIAEMKHILPTFVSAAVLSTEVNITVSRTINNKGQVLRLVRVLLAWAIDGLRLRQLECEAKLQEDDRSDVNKSLSDPESEAEITELSKWLTEIDNCEAGKALYQEWLCDDDFRTDPPEILAFRRAFQKNLPILLSLLAKDEKRNKTDYRDGRRQRILKWWREEVVGLDLEHN